MALERKDVRLKLREDWHQLMSAIARSENIDLADWAERILLTELERRRHEAMVIHLAAQRAGISGKDGE